MASGILKPSRIIAVLILLAAGGWIASGSLAPSQEHDGPGEAEPAAPTAPILKVTVAAATPQQHQRSITLSCTTEA
ncbi:MAG: hypothetical protein J0H08_13890, partial [Rhizobiales bacterium]|nr:hypothetical protein [Hyphomicrobiales bacterium]